MKEAVLEFVGHTPKELASFSDEGLEAYNKRLMRFKDRVRDEQRQVQRELSKRKALEKFEGMSEVEQAAVREHLALPPTQTVSVHGIGTEALVGKV